MNPADFLKPRSALAGIGVLTFAALAIDSSRAYSNKRHAQNAADTAVLDFLGAHPPA
mgnify:CR=1 FL=1